MRREDCVSRCAEGQNHVITTAQLLRCGVSESAISRRVRNGRLHVLFAAHKLVIEVDGDKFHKTRYRRKKDARKQAIVEAAGLRVIRLVPDDVEPENETQTVARLGHAIPDD